MSSVTWGQLPSLSTATVSCDLAFSHFSRPSPPPGFKTGGVFYSCLSPAQFQTLLDESYKTKSVLRTHLPTLTAPTGVLSASDPRAGTHPSFLEDQDVLIPLKLAPKGGTRTQEEQVSSLC